MQYNGTVNSYNKSTNKDCFGNGGTQTWDHIWPTDLGGSNTLDNKQILTQKSNGEKGNDTKGVVNGIRFAVERVSGTDGEIVGQMYIKIGNTWKLVIPTR